MGNGVQNYHPKAADNTQRDPFNSRSPSVKRFLLLAAFTNEENKSSMIIQFALFVLI